MGWSDPVDLSVSGVDAILKVASGPSGQDNPSPSSRGAFSFSGLVYGTGSRKSRMGWRCPLQESRMLLNRGGPM